jgi:hypothetical protein
MCLLQVTARLQQCCCSAACAVAALDMPCCHQPAAVHQPGAPCPTFASSPAAAAVAAQGRRAAVARLAHMQARAAAAVAAGGCRWRVLHPLLCQVSCAPARRPDDWCLHNSVGWSCAVPTILLPSYTFTPADASFACRAFLHRVQSPQLLSIPQFYFPQPGPAPEARRELEERLSAALAAAPQGLAVDDLKRLLRQVCACWRGTGGRGSAPTSTRPCCCGAGLQQAVGCSIPRQPCSPVHKLLRQPGGQ